MLLFIRIAQGVILEVQTLGQPQQRHLRTFIKNADSKASAQSTEFEQCAGTQKPVFSLVLQEVLTQVKREEDWSRETG